MDSRSRASTLLLDPSVAGLLALAAFQDPSSDIALLLGAVDGPVIERLAAGEGFEPKPRWRQLATALVAA